MDTVVAQLTGKKSVVITMTAINQACVLLACCQLGWAPTPFPPIDNTVDKND